MSTEEEIAHPEPGRLLGRLHLFGPLEHHVDAADEIERLLRNVVEVAGEDLLEAPDRLLDRNELALDAGELLGDEERLGEELLDLARARDRELVLFRELVDAEDRDDVLEVLVALERPL